MARYQHGLDQLIGSIKNGTCDLETIKLANALMTEEDINNLCLALQEHSEIASNIKILNLSANNIKKITIPNTLVNLRVLDLSNNQLDSVILPSVLKGLMSLNLENNKLTSLHIPNTLNNLALVNLSSNLLEDLNIPINLNKLTLLYLNNNNLSTLTRQILVILKPHLNRCYISVTPGDNGTQLQTVQQSMLINWYQKHLTARQLVHYAVPNIPQQDLTKLFSLLEKICIKRFGGCSAGLIQSKIVEFLMPKIEIDAILKQYGLRNRFVVGPRVNSALLSFMATTEAKLVAETRNIIYGYSRQETSTDPNAPRKRLCLSAN